MPFTSSCASIPTIVTDPDALQALYGEPGEASLKKEVDHVHPHYRAFIEASPFAMLATAGPDGLDASPRGDPAGFVVVEDEKTLLLPDRRGNNRIDSLRNILADPRVALLFLVPGVGETLRVNGLGRISTDPRCWNASAWTASCRARCWWSRCRRCIPVRARCARACGTRHPDAAQRPAQRRRILSDLTAGTFDGVAYDRDLPARVAKTLY